MRDDQTTNRGFDHRILHAYCLFSALRFGKAGTRNCALTRGRTVRLSIPMTMRCCLLFVLASLTSLPLVAEEPLSRIAFGSCANEKRPQPVWQAINALNPQLFIFTGDNVYADTADPAKLRASYAKLSEIPGFAALRAAVPVIGTWDDHDYGKNDAGVEFAGKEAAKEAFMAFFATPEDSPAAAWWSLRCQDFRPRGQTGPSHSARHAMVPRSAPHDVKDELKAARAATGKPVGRYLPDTESESTMLGEEQWNWLTAELKKPAELRLLVSGIQVLALDHGWEKWGNLPRERKRLLEVIRDNATNVVILSGDRHSSDISLLPRRRRVVLFTRSMTSPRAG